MGGLIMDAVVYGGQDIYVSIFNSIAIMMGTSAFGSFIRVIMLLGLVMLIFQTAFKMDIKSIIQWVITIAVTQGLLFIPKTTVHISDRLSTGTPVAVANVPLGLGFLFSVTSQAGDWMIREMETSFGDPEVARYSENGMIYASRIFTELNNVRAPNESQIKYIRSYMNNCVMYELLDEQYTITDLMNSDDILAFITTENPPNPGRAGTWGDTVISCTDMASQLSTIANQAATAAIPSFTQRLQNNFSNTVLETAVMADLAGAQQLLINNSQAATETFVQAMMVNAVRDSVQDFRVSTGASPSSYSTTRAELQTRNQNMLSARLSQKWVPILKMVLEILFYSMFPILAPFFFLPGMGVQLIKQYLTGFLILQAWGPLYVVLNKIMMHAAIISSQAAAVDGTAHPITAANLSNLASANADIASIAGYATSLIPVIATALAYGTMRLTSQSESMLASVNSAASEAARDETQGNMNLGTTGYELHRFDQMFGRQNSTSMTEDTGRVVMNTAEGGRLTINPDDSQTYNAADARSNLNMNLGLSERIGSELRSSAGEQASLAQTLSESASQQHTRAEDSLLSYSSTNSSGLSSAFGTRLTEDAQLRESVGYIESLMNSQDRGVSSEVGNTRQESRQARGELYGDIYAGGDQGFLGINVGGARAGARGSLGAEISASNNEVTRASLTENMSESERNEFDRHMSVIENAMTSQELSQTGSETDSELRSIQEAYRASESYSEQASLAFSRSQQASELASAYESNSLDYTRPLDDEFLDYYQARMAQEGRATDLGWQGDVMSLYQNDPGALDDLVADFAQTKVSELTHWEAGQAGITGGEDVASGISLDDARGLRGDVEAYNDLERSQLDGEGLGVDPNVQTQITGHVSDIRQQAETGIAEGQGNNTFPDDAPAYRDMRALVHDVRNDRDGSQFNSAERRENLEAEADASMSAFFSGMPTGAPQVNLDSVESLGRDETEVDRNIRHLNRFQNDQ
jgi:conjugal transfer mating pair stabilization protein TraG